jgi:malyl-CoA/(S)-citramalyl-CoA lyase
MWHYAIARIVVAARANGLRPVDGPFGDISDPAGFEAQARRSAALGCDGKWVIHPSQMDSEHKIFSPSAEAVLDAMAEARRGGRGAASLNGKMIDLASVRQAENLVHKAASIAAKAS